MLSYSKKISLFLLAVFFLTAIFFSGFAQASFWDMIKAWVTINPLSVDVSTLKEVEIDKVFKVTAKIINKGGEKIENAKGEIFLPEGLVLLKKDPVQKIGIIPPRKEKKIFWSVKGEKIGDYVISVKVSGELKEKPVSAEDSTMVKIIEKGSSGGEHRFGFFQRFFNFLREWFRF